MKTLSIPVQPHVLKYLQVHLPAEYELSLADHFGLFLNTLLQEPLVDQRKDSFVATKCSAEFKVGLPTYKKLQAFRENLTTNNVFLFNSFVYKIILKDFYGFVELATQSGLRQKAAIEAFMEKHDFTDSDLSYETLKKSYQRYVDEEEKKKRGPYRSNWRRDLAELRKQLLQIPLPTMGFRPSPAY